MAPLALSTQSFTGRQLVHSSGKGQERSPAQRVQHKMTCWR